MNKKLILLLLLVTVDSAATLSKSDIRCLQILSYTKRQTEALIIEHMSGNTDYGIAHLEFMSSLENPRRVIHCAQSKKILREYNLLDCQGRIPQKLYRACAYHKAKSPSSGGHYKSCSSRYCLNTAVYSQLYCGALCLVIDTTAANV